MSALSKSDLMSFYQCPKRPWLEKNKANESRDEPDEMIIAYDEAIAQLVREQFPSGIYIETLNRHTALQLTQQHIETDAPLFEPVFEDDGVSVDILHGDTLTEIKNGTVRVTSRIKSPTRLHARELGI